MPDHRLIAADRIAAGESPTDRSTILTVGQLRTALAELDVPDDAYVALDITPGVDDSLRTVWVQASDAVPSDAGTDPVYESTVGVLMLSNERVPSFGIVSSP